MLLTGGDPLVFSDDGSTGCSASCARSRTSRSIRLGTRLPVTLPFRVTDALCAPARAPPPDLGEHALQPPEGAHAPRRPRPCDRLHARGLPGRQPERAAARHQRRRRDDEGALRGSRAHARAARTTAIRRSCSRAPRTSACRSSAASRSSARCAVAPAASRFRSTCSTRPTARCRLAHPTCAAARATTCVVESYDGRIWREPNPL